MTEQYRIICTGGEEYLGHTPYIKMAIWRPRRKPEPTLCLNLDEYKFVSIPCNQVKSMLPFPNLTA